MPVVVIDDSLKPVDPNKDPVKTTLLDVAYLYGKRDVEKKDFMGHLQTVQEDVLTSVLVIKGTNTPLVINKYTENQLLNAIIYAYNNHIGLRLTPDDILHCFSTAVVQCLNDNSEKYRDVFVNHQGKKKMIVKTDCNPGQFDWPMLLDMMSVLIDKNVKSSLGLESEFTTTTAVTKTVGHIMKMAAFKSYFDYGFELGCGIRKVELTGTLEDWLKLREKITKCVQIFTSRGNMVNWSKHFLKIVDNLIETFKCNDKVSDDLMKFWSRIVTYVPYGSGGQKYVSGWAKVLFPGKKYDQFPEKLNLLKLNSNQPVDDRSNYYGWQSKMKAWAQLCEDVPNCLSYVEAELNDHGFVYDFMCTVGHLGWNLKDDFTESVLSYVVHALPKDQPEITNGSAVRKDNLEVYREEQKKHLEVIKAQQRKQHKYYEE